MIRRLKKHTATGWYVAAVVILLIMLRWLWGSFSADPLAVNFELRDGLFRVEQVIDPMTMIVRGDAADSQPFRLRLAGIQLPDTAGDREYDQALQLTLEFIHKNGEQKLTTQHPQAGPWISLQFDRTHLTEDKTALAYLSLGNELLNVELARSGWAIPDPVSGNSASIQRKINRAANEAKAQQLGVHLNRESPQQTD